MRSAIVPFTQQQMFDLVNDVCAYPEFIPNCSKARVLNESDSTLEAELTLTKGGLEQAFVTQNSLNYPHSMRLTLKSGPFKRFDGHWQFLALEQGCKVSFELEYQFSNMLLGLTVGKLMEHLASQQVDVMCARARVLYQQQSNPNQEG